MLEAIEEKRNQLLQAEIIQTRGRKETAVIPHQEENHPRQVIKLREAVTRDHLQDHHLLPHLQEAAEAAAVAQATGEDNYESA